MGLIVLITGFADPAPHVAPGGRRRACLRSRNAQGVPNAMLRPEATDMNRTSITCLPFSIDRLWALCSDPVFSEQKFLASGAESVSIHRFVATPTNVELELEHEACIGPCAMPNWFREWGGSRQTLRERTGWRRTGPRRAEMEIEIVPVGVPARIDGRGMACEPVPGLTFVLTNWHVTSTLPYLGDQVELLFAERIDARVRGDREFMLRFAGARARAAAARGPVDVVLHRP